MLTDSIALLLGALWLAWAAVLFGGFVFGKSNEDNTRRIPLWNRLGSSLILVAAAWFVWFAVPNSADLSASLLKTLAFFVAVGMTLGCLGDFFMAQMLRIKNYVLGGIASFGLGHVAYIFGIVAVYQQTNTPLTNALPVMLIAWLMGVALKNLLLRTAFIRLK